MPIELEIVTPERLAYSDTVDAVVLPGSEGELGVLPNHAPLVSMLGVGELRIRNDGQEESFAIVGGFLQVRPNKVVVMAETADLGSEIDVGRPRRHAARPSAPWRAGTPRGWTCPLPGPSSSRPCCASASPSAPSGGSATARIGLRG